MKKMSVVTGAVLMTASIFAVDLSTNVSTENVTEEVEEISILTDDDLEENMKKENGMTYCLNQKHAKFS